MEIKGILFKQFELEMLQLSVSIDFLVENSRVAYFSEDKEVFGYQRPLNIAHYKSIAKYLTKVNNPILPTTVLAAIDSDKIDEFKREKISGIEFGSLEIVDKIRLVDGQHRVEAFRYLKKVDENEYSKLKDILIPVTLLIVTKPQRLYEIRTFVDINKKGKKVSTDLAIVLQSEIVKMGESNDFTDYETMVNHIATEISLKLERDNNSVWHNAITKSPFEPARIVSINTFTRTLKPIIKKRLVDTNDLSFETSNKTIDSLSADINELWNTAKDTWKDAFEVDGKSTYNKNYVIQKTLGVEVLHKLYKDNEADSFKEIIQSPLQTKHWASGKEKLMSGLSSGSGINTAYDYLLGVQPIPDSYI